MRVDECGHAMDKQREAFFARVTALELRLLSLDGRTNGTVVDPEGGRIGRLEKSFDRWQWLQIVTLVSALTAAVGTIVTIALKR